MPDGNSHPSGRDRAALERFVAGFAGRCPTARSFRRMGRRMLAVRMLVAAIHDCHDADAVQVMDRALQELGGGLPLGWVGSIRDNARFWAATASEAEKKQYLLAIFAELSDRDRVAAIGAMQAVVLK